MVASKRESKVPVISKKDNSRAYQITFTSGGAVPATLRGAFTDTRRAERAILDWKAEEKVKEMSAKEAI